MDEWVRWGAQVIVVPVVVWVYLTMSRFRKDVDAHNVQLALLQQSHTDHVLSTQRQLDAIAKNHENELAEFRDQINDFRNEFKTEIRGLRADLSGSLKDVSAQIFKLLAEPSK